MDKIGLLGNGGQADEVESYLSKGLEVIFRALSTQYLDSSSNLANLIDIEKPEEYKEFKVLAAVGAPALKKILVEAWPGAGYIILVSSRAIVDSSLIIGMGSIVTPGTVVTTNVVIGEHVLINIGATVSHNCTIGSFTTISPGVHIAGNVEIGEGVFIGIGALISNNVKIAAGSVIGAGAVILEDITVNNSVVVGAPGKVIRTNEGWLSEI